MMLCGLLPVLKGPAISPPRGFEIILALTANQLKMSTDS